jgi:hypothetical protein
VPRPPFLERLRRAAFERRAIGGCDDQIVLVESID